MRYVIFEGFSVPVWAEVGATETVSDSFGSWVWGKNVEVLSLKNVQVGLEEFRHPTLRNLLSEVYYW